MIEIIERLRYLISGNLDEVTADDLEVAGNEIERLQARLNEAIQCCSIKDSRLLRQEARLAEQSVQHYEMHKELRARLAEAEDAIERAGRCLAMSNKGAAEALAILRAAKRAADQPIREG